MKLVNWLLTAKVYAARGYVSLVGWIVTIGTFTMVFYGYLVETYPPLLSIFPNVFLFMFVSIPLGLIFLAIIGRWDWKKGTFPREGRISFQNNPEWRALRNDVKNIEYKLLLIDIKLDELVSDERI